MCLGSFAFISAAQSPQKGTEKLFPILLNKKWGYINADGDVVIKPQFDGAGEFKEGLAVASLDGRRGFIDGTGQFVIRTKASINLAGSFSEGVAPVIENGKWGY